jgi:predicted CoA-binding protein
MKTTTPVNPHMQTFDGDRCYPDLQSIPGASTAC